MKMNKNFLKCIIGILILSYCSSCRYDKYEVPVPEEIKDETLCSSPMPDSVSFSKNIIPILKSNCSTTNCHSGNFPEGNLNLESGVAYARLSKKGSGYIDTINPKNSVLYSSLVSQSNPMPPTGRLDDCSVKLIYKWMQQKAKNN